jgi:hypothetical protein
MLFALALLPTVESRGVGLTLAEPVLANLDTVLRTPVSTWRSPIREVFRWERFPEILIIDSVDYQTQDRMFTRLAYFLEKKGFRGRLMTNAQLEGRHGWNAHDYGPGGLSLFFNAASAKGFLLNPEEEALESLALREGILLPVAEHVAPGEGGILAIARSASETERRYLLTHESFHGIFFSSPAYRDFSFKLWDSLPAKERNFYTDFLGSLGYDNSDHFLVVNEFQAYLMQQPLEYALSYFERFVARFGGTDPRASVDPAHLLATAKELDGFLRSSFGIQAGETVGPVIHRTQGQ